MPSKKSSDALGALASQLTTATDTAANSVVAIHARRRIPSSGIAWRDGLVVSASHTVRQDGEVSLTLPTGETTTATVIGRDPSTDLVALRAEGVQPHVIARAPDATARVGALVLAVGRPGRDVTATFGIISGIAEQWRSWQGTRVERLVRLDLSVRDGFSGGPLVDVAGEVIGMNNSALARGAPVALPAAVIDRVLDELVAHGHMRRPYVGVAIQAVALGAGAVARHGLAHDTALLVMSVADGSPADKAGLLIGDVLLEASGQPLRRPTDFLDALSNAGVGAALELMHLRGGERKSVSVVPADRSGSGARE